jgi:hypothetical protein
VFVGAAVSFTRIGGHATWEWVPLLVGLDLGATASRSTLDRSAPAVVNGGRPAPMPPCLDGIDIVGIDWRAAGVARRGSRPAPAHAHRGRPSVGPQFVVEPRGEQERLLAGWGDLLGQYAVERGVVSHLSWSDLAQPSGMGDHIAWLRSDERGTPNHTAAASYRELLEVGTTSAINHEAVVTITVARERLSRHRAGKGASTSSFVERSSPRSRRSCVGLRSADLAASDPLDPDRAPAPRPVPHRPRRRSAPSPRGTSRRAPRSRPRRTAGPLALDTDWRHLRSTERSTALGGSAPGLASLCHRPGSNRSSPAAVSPGR